MPDRQIVHAEWQIDNKQVKCRHKLLEHHQELNENKKKYFL